RLFVQFGDQKIDQIANFSVAFQRPNLLRMEVYQAKMVVDGKKLYASIGGLPNQILEKDAPHELTMKSVYFDPEFAAEASNNFAGSAPQLLLLLDDKALEVLLRDAEEPKLLESGIVDGEKCFRVQVRRPDGVLVFWIDQQSFVLRRMTLPTDDFRRELTRQNGQPVDTIALSADFLGAQVNRSIDPRAFSFEIPTGAEIRSYFLPPHPGQLLAKKTPDFTFVDLDGKPITARDLAGKIVIVDFWATWCEPCRTSLAELQKVYEKYRHNDKLAFLAVNLDDPQLENKVITDFLKKSNLSVPVYRDPDRSAILFNFSGIPASFIIDAQGIVEDYEAGADPELSVALPKKIESLLAGKHIYEALLKRYRNEVKQYEKLLTTENSEAETDAKLEEYAIPQTEIAKPSKPGKFKLTLLWKCTDLKSPGNILVREKTGAEARLLVVENPNSVAEIGLDGKLIALNEPKIGHNELFTNLRSFTASDGKTYLALFASAQQRCHLLDDKWNLILSYPKDALENPHSGIADVQIGSLDGAGAPKLYVGYWGPVGVQAVSLEGKRLWSYRLLSNVSRMAISQPNKDGQRDLICTDSDGSLARINAKGKLVDKVTVPNRMLFWIVDADLAGKGKPY
ncbi:MAG: redoxin domain-containing protein, partial [Thermoguttaceae bacterium]